MKSVDSSQRKTEAQKLRLARNEIDEEHGMPSCHVATKGRWPQTDNRRAPNRISIKHVACFAFPDIHLSVPIRLRYCSAPRNP